MTCVIYGMRKAFVGRMQPVCQCLDHAGLDSKTKLEPKNGSVGLRPRPGNLSWKHPSIVTSPTDKPHSKRKKLFDLNYEACWVRRGCEQISSSIVWRGMVLQSFSKKWRMLYSKRVFLSVLTLCFKINPSTMLLISGKNCMSSRYVNVGNTWTLCYNGISINCVLHQKRKYLQVAGKEN